MYMYTYMYMYMYVYMQMSMYMHVYMYVDLDVDVDVRKVDLGGNYFQTKKRSTTNKKTQIIMISNSLLDFALFWLFGFFLVLVFFLVVVYFFLVRLLFFLVRRLFPGSGSENPMNS